MNGPRADQLLLANLGGYPSGSYAGLMIRIGIMARAASNPAVEISIRTRGVVPNKAGRDPHQRPDDVFLCADLETRRSELFLREILDRCWRRCRQEGFPRRPPSAISKLAAAPTTYWLLRIPLRISKRRAKLSTVQPTAESTCPMSYAPVCAQSDNGTSLCHTRHMQALT